MQRQWKLSLLWMGLLCLALCGPAQAAPYVTTARIVPVFESLDQARSAPTNENWETFLKEMELASVVYGDMLEASPSSEKGWLILTDTEGNELGWVHESALTPFPDYDPMEARSYQVMEEKVVPFLLPGKKPLSDFDSFSLPYGTVVSAIGKAQAEGKTWLLCVFGTDFFSFEDGGTGSDKRCGWIDEETAVDLAASTPDLSRVEENKLPATLEGAARTAVLKNGFYVDPTPVFFDYLNQDDLIDAYAFIPSLTPRFITVDLPLHAFHLYFDRMLQKMEGQVLIPRTFELLSAMNEALADLPHDLETSELGRGAASTVVDFLAVAMHLLTNGGSELHSAEEFAAMALEGSGTGFNPFTFTDRPQDFTLFAPRGHYTLNEDLKAYFRTTYLLGNPFPLDKPEGAAATLLLCHILSTPQVQEKWRALVDPILYLVGSSNVNTWDDLASALKGFRLGDLGDPSKVKALLAALDKAGKESAVQKMPGKKFAVLPRRLTFDAMLFDALTFPEVGTQEKPRALPDPLDVMAALGSSAALEEAKTFAGYENYTQLLQERAASWPSFRDSKDGDNVYTAWLSFFETYFRPTSSEQFFSLSPAWAYKKLTTAEGSMAELKHDTILYAEQSGAEMGDGGNGWIAAPYALPIPRGYLEPEPELFKAIAACARRTKALLGAMFQEEYEYYSSRLSEFADQMDNLAAIADRALEDAMTQEDFLALRDLRLPDVLPEGVYDLFGEEAQNQAKMALTADVATNVVNGSSALYMAVGTPRKLQVYVNDRSGGFRLTEGYMFSYYTFVRGLDEGRMNDDDWKAIVYDTENQKALKDFLPSWHGKLNP
ncbi:MAG: DUF3160 domain-containing protein [Fretibacterium sp.]|nr:DUF3160 domain-containing protein [Fretibacterium sp.]